MVGRVRWSPRPGQIVLRNPVCNEGKDGGSTVSLDPISHLISMGYGNQPTRAARVTGLSCVPSRAAENPMMKRRGAAVTRAIVLITALATLPSGCDSPFGPSETELEYGLEDVAMVSDGGVDLSIRYDSFSRGFEGRLTNTTNAPVSARVEVLLSSGRTYDSVFDVAPGEIHYILIATTFDRFTSWSVTLSV